MEKRYMHKTKKHMINEKNEYFTNDFLQTHQHTEILISI